MHTLLKIGREEYLLPNVEVATKIMKLMAEAVPVEDWCDRLVIDDEPLNLALKTVRPNTKFARKTKEDPYGENPENEIIVPPAPRIPKRLAGPRKLLGNGR